MTVSPDGKTAYAEIFGNIYAYDIASGTLLTVYSGNGHAPDGTGVISGGTFNGDIVVNNNDGTVGLIDVNTNVETIIASGGTRGDFVGPDLTNGTLFLASADQVERLGLYGRNDWRWRRPSAGTRHLRLVRRWASRLRLAASAQECVISCLGDKRRRSLRAAVLVGVAGGPAAP